MWNSLKSAKRSWLTGWSSGAEAEKISRPSSSRPRSAILAMRSAIFRSRAVQVGDLNITVSEMMAAAMRPASLGEGIMPRS